MSRIGEAHWHMRERDGLLRRLRRTFPWWLESRRTSRVIALVHFRGNDGEVITQKISAWYLDVEIHDGELVLTNAHGEGFSMPIDGLLTLEIR